MNTRELVTTLVLSFTTAGGAFFSANVADVGLGGAAWAAGGAFFSAFAALMVALGYDPRRRAAAAVSELEALELALSDGEVERIADAVLRRLPPRA